MVSRARHTPYLTSAEPKCIWHKNRDAAFLVATAKAVGIQGLAKLAHACLLTWSHVVDSSYAVVSFFFPPDGVLFRTD